jgi:predicted RNA-binding protein with PIN domain
MTGTLFIDGFNLYHTHRPNKSLFSDISSMLYAIETYAAGKGMRACVVLDGTGFHQQFNDTPTLRILCSEAGQTADAVLEANMHDLPVAQRLPSLVVTGDRNLANMALGTGVRHMSCPMFLKELQEFGRSSKRAHDSGSSESFSINRPFDKLR